MNASISQYTWLRTPMTALDMCWFGGKGRLDLFWKSCYSCAVIICTFSMLRSMLRGKLKRNLKRWRTLRALRVESALSFRPRTSWKRVSAVSLDPMKKRELKRQRKMRGWNTAKTNVDTTIRIWVFLWLSFRSGMVLQYVALLSLLCDIEGAETEAPYLRLIKGRLSPASCGALRCNSSCFVFPH